MQHRISLFVMFTTCVVLLAFNAVDEAQLRVLFAQLPGGLEGVPRITLRVFGMLDWLSRWWPLCILLGAAATLGLPSLLRRTPAGERLVANAARWMTQYHGTVVVLFVALMFILYRTISQALFLPMLKIIEQLTSR